MSKKPENCLMIEIEISLVITKLCKAKFKNEKFII